jgi:hypothetical protein
MTLGQIVSLLYPTARWREDYETTIRPEHPDGETIDRWNAAKLGPQPTAAELRARAAEAEAGKGKADKLSALAATDAGIIRGVDDLWALMISKGVVKAEDRPAPLAEKLDARAELRAQIQTLEAEVVSK